MKVTWAKDIDEMNAAFIPDKVERALIITALKRLAKLHPSDVAKHTLHTFEQIDMAIEAMEKCRRGPQ